MSSMEIVEAVVNALLQNVVNEQQPPHAQDKVSDQADDGDDSATESLPVEELCVEEEAHDRSDGSDSGLGLELSDDLTTFEKDIGAILDEARPAPPRPPGRSSLKRRMKTNDDDDVEDAPRCKKKRSIVFDNVTVYYFPRAQGFTCVPSQGGSTLGMGAHHAYCRKFSIAEHALEQRRIHRQLLQQLRSERQVTTVTSSGGGGGGGATSSDDTDSDDEPSDVSESELDLDNYYFLQPVPTRQRRALLRAAGVRKIDLLEKDECRDIRTSREFCGCGCKGYCDPDTCSCSQAGIKCQVDRLNFPCGCSRDNCGNSSGRIEFNPVRVRTHFIHTLMRLELEKKQQQQEKEKNVGSKTTSWMESERLMAGASNLPKYNMNLLRDGVTMGTLPTREDSLDLYTFREDCYQEERSKQETFPANFHFPTPPTAPPDATPYTPTPSNQYHNHHHHHHDHPLTSPSTETSSFNDFNRIFNPYQLYPSSSSEFSSNANGGEPSTHEESLNYPAANKEPQQYTNLNTVGANNRSIESFSDLLAVGRYATTGAQSSSSTTPFHYTDASYGHEGSNETKSSSSSSDGGESKEAKSNSDECEEGQNFGEIIKKSIVETVSA